MEIQHVSLPSVNMRILSSSLFRSFTKVTQSSKYVSQYVHLKHACRIHNAIFDNVQIENGK